MGGDTKEFDVRFDTNGQPYGARLHIELPAAAVTSTPR